MEQVYVHPSKSIDVSEAVIKEFLPNLGTVHERTFLFLSSFIPWLIALFCYDHKICLVLQIAGCLKICLQCFHFILLFTVKCQRISQ